MSTFNYNYDNQIKHYILQVMAIFASMEIVLVNFFFIFFQNVAFLTFRPRRFRQKSPAPVRLKPLSGLSRFRRVNNYVHPVSELPKESDLWRQSHFAFAPPLAAAVVARGERVGEDAGNCGVDGHFLRLFKITKTISNNTWNGISQ